MADVFQKFRESATSAQGDFGVDFEDVFVDSLDMPADCETINISDEYPESNPSTSEDDVENDN